MDDMSQGTFDIIWDDIVNNKSENENNIVSVQEMTTYQFKEMYGIDWQELDGDWDIVSEQVEVKVGEHEHRENDELSTDMQTDQPSASSRNAQNEPMPLNANQENIQPRDHFDTLSHEDVLKEIKEQENKNTAKKTKSDVHKFQRFLASKGESRELQTIEPEELDELVANFTLSVKKIDGSEYEPTTIRNMISSIDRHLKTLKYPVRIIHEGREANTNFFQLSRSTLVAKQKKLGKGNKPNAAAPITVEEIDMLYNKGLLGMATPKSLMNTIWLNNCVNFGMRGVTENYNLRWSDVQLKASSNGIEYIELNERQTKTRTGADVTNVRAVKPKMWATPLDPERCPVAHYKLYAEKRPDDYRDDQPFYLAPRTTAVKLPGDMWFTRMRLGEKKLSSMLKNMSVEGELSETKKLTNHSSRKHMIKKMMSAGMAPTDMIQISGHANVQSILTYSELDEDQHQIASKILSNTRPNGHPLAPQPQTNINTQSVIPLAPQPQSNKNLQPFPPLPLAPQAQPNKITQSITESVTCQNNTTSSANITHTVGSFDAVPISTSGSLQPLSVSEQCPHPTHQIASISQNHNQLQSLFGGATVHIGNFHVYMK